MKHKVSEVDGDLLDAAVAMAEGWVPLDAGKARRAGLMTMSLGGVHALLGQLNYSRDWALGGPILERAQIAVQPCGSRWISAGDDQTLATYPWEGSTPLVAAMRAYLGVKIGNEVELPADWGEL